MKLEKTNLLTYKYQHFLHKTNDEKDYMPVQQVDLIVCDQILNRSIHEDVVIHIQTQVLLYVHG